MCFDGFPMLDYILNPKPLCVARLAIVIPVVVPLMDKLLHDPMYLNFRHCGTVVYIKSRRILSVRGNGGSISSTSNNRRKSKP